MSYDSKLTKEQTELEKPVKGYQFKELTKAFTELQTEISKNKIDTDNKLQTIIDGQKGIVTHEFLTTTLKDFRDDLVRDMKIEYGPTKTTVKTWSTRLWAIVMVSLAALIGNLVALLKAFRG